MPVLYGVPYVRLLQFRLHQQLTAEFPVSYDFHGAHLSQQEPCSYCQVQQKSLSTIQISFRNTESIGINSSKFYPFNRGMILYSFATGLLCEPFVCLKEKLVKSSANTVSVDHQIQPIRLHILKSSLMYDSGL